MVKFRYRIGIALMAAILAAAPTAALADETEAESVTMEAAAETEAPAPPQTEAPAPPQTEAPAPPQTEAPAPPQTEAPAPPQTEAPAPPQTEAPAPTQTETPASTEKQTQAAETEKQSESATEANSEAVSETATETQTETPSSETQTDGISETAAPYYDPDGYGYDGTFAPYVSDEFRFKLVEDAPEVLIREGASAREDKTKDSKPIAIAKEMSRARILASDEGEDWYFIESGDARGFVNRNDMVEGSIAKGMISAKGFKNFPLMTLLVNPSKNKAVDFTDTTTEENIVPGIRMKAVADTNVKEGQSADSRSVGSMSVGDVCYALEDLGNGWLYAESGDVRGFVSEGSLMQTGGSEESGESLAEKLVEPAENAALRYTLKSTKKADESGRKRTALVEFAKQFVGNPYVWGGESLTHGADCSGFVMKVFENFGISLPRVACDQATQGRKIKVSEAKPGDLIFYWYDGGVNHVAICIGNGQVVHAANSRQGIITGPIYSSACWAADILG